MNPISQVLKPSSPQVLSYTERVRTIALILAILIAAAAAGDALVVSEFPIASDRERVERQRRGGRGGFNVSPAAPEDFDGLFQFCRVAFRGNRAGDGGGWGVDFPRADINMSIRLSELTKTTVSFAAPQEPNHVVVRLTDETLFQCPMVMMTEVGAAYLDTAEAEALRTYVLKGGFVWADDFWGEYAWQAWTDQLSKALPPARISDSRSREGPSAVPHACSTSAACRRLPRLGTGWAAAAARQSAAPTAPCRTRAASSTRRAG